MSFSDYIYILLPFPHSFHRVSEDESLLSYLNCQSIIHWTISIKRTCAGHLAIAIALQNDSERKNEKRGCSCRKNWHNALRVCGSDKLLGIRYMQSYELSSREPKILEEVSPVGFKAWLFIQWVCFVEILLFLFWGDSKI